MTRPGQDNAATRLAARSQTTARSSNAKSRAGGELEAQRALFFLLSAYDLATEMWFQKGDPAAPVLTNWERPWRKYGGDNPTTIYLSAPISPAMTYRLQGPIGDAVYAGVQVYTAARATTRRRPTSPIVGCSGTAAISTC